MITLLLALLAASPQVAAAPPVPSALTQESRTHEETQLERDTRRLATELRCPVCQGLSLQDSPSELSQEMRAIIREQLVAGKSVAEVKDYFVDKYGEWILLEPEPEGFNLVVYIAPALLLLAGAGFLYVTARRWTRRSDAPAEAAAPADETVNAR